ncbi:hypothetical protein [Singulisphaera acidiphila]|uniref:Uncharacterized protein n=1 Tax=Singulisphaera acidiphila (strain ATCC BAA-1392 / DSM 18658 / VKM B-2454 / MOB10) TaxID=886293 RepID=L0DCW4_SINAD|nr:hypothetical protein [Singulisphaera acidiphila]AGA26678.1 hypothetical protein Sinac_2366 [Singulisphaera acidiphila DSM 18658]
MRIGPIELMVVAFSGLLYLWPIWRICRKAGFPGALSLLAIIPAANTVSITLVGRTDVQLLE